MDKITIFLKYTGSKQFSSCATAREDLFAIPDLESKIEQFILIGEVESFGANHDYIKPWWQPNDRTFKLSWYSSDSKNSVLEYIKVSELENIFKPNDWEPSEATIEYNAYAGKHKDRFLNKFDIFNSIPASVDGYKILDFPDGTYTVNNQTITCWSHDGHIISITDRYPLMTWTDTYNIHKYGPLRIAPLIWSENCMLLDNQQERWFFYYEMYHPNNEIGASFQSDLDHNVITLNDDAITEFIDQIYFTCPNLKKMCPSYNTWPALPFTFNNRYRDSKGYYFVFFAEMWTCTPTEWTNNQLNYLKDFLDRTPKYIGDKDAILAYAREKWTIQ
jgi:hypothetical protein